MILEVFRNLVDPHHGVISTCCQQIIVKVECHMIQAWIFFAEVGIKLLEETQLSILLINLEEDYCFVGGGDQYICALSTKYLSRQPLEGQNLHLSAPSSSSQQHPL